MERVGMLVLLFYFILTGLVFFQTSLGDLIQRQIRELTYIAGMAVGNIERKALITNLNTPFLTFIQTRFRFE